MSDLNPRGATHYRQNNDGRRTHFKIRDGYHFVWLGIKHGGWSMRLDYPHYQQSELIEVTK